MAQLDHHHSKYFAIVPAAGSGQRMQSAQAKQYLQIGSRCILQITLETLLAEQQIEQVIVCLATDDSEWAKLACATDDRITAAQGGDTRAQSVINGLNCLNGIADDSDWVLVHDAARPCLGSSMLRNFLLQLQSDEVGGILAVPAKDTLKQVQEGSEYVAKTLDRSQIWHAQTPQMFRYGLLRQALSDALDSHLQITDESSAMEAAGFPVKLIEGDSKNIKITTPEDLMFARSIIEIALQ
jgi:2-C-methyl-D-erythritol 4-phosphate cytidylyltransferase